MKTTSNKFKQIMASGAARKYLCNIYFTLADNTTFTLTEDDIWEDSFKIDTATSGTSSFDIGSAIIGKCSFTINNIEGDFDDYDFFNAQAIVWLGLEGDITNNQQQYYRMGIYTVDEPQIANGLISLELLDNLWRFDVPLTQAGITYTGSTTARTIVNQMCSYCGVTLATQSFNGYDIIISEAPKDAENMNCREMLQYIAMLGCNFCVINDAGSLEIKWYNNTADEFDRNFSTKFGTTAIEITGVKVIIDGTAYTKGSSGYVLELENPLFTADNVSGILNNYIWINGRLKNFTLRTFNNTTLSDLSAEPGDKIKFKDYQGNNVYSYITNNSFSFANHLIQCNAVSPQRTLVKRYSKAVQVAVEKAREQANKMISSYDEVAQEMNNLAINAMGAYQEYEDRPTGGRWYYLSNMPITKDPDTGICSFAAGSTVFKSTGDGFFVSTDGGQTWVNGYDASTGLLLVNLLYTIGLHADWIRTGTLTVGGSNVNPPNPEILVRDAQDNAIVVIDNGGITMHKGVISSPDYAEASGATYSTTGMKLDVLNKILRSPYFAIDQSGAYFKGTIQITGDIEISRGSFRPTDYYIATDFYLQFKQADEYTGTGTVVIKRHNFTQQGGVWVENTTTVDTITLTDDEPELSTILDHNCGVNGKDYYELDITSSSTVTTVAKDISLAYVGREGFRGFLQGIFEGYLKTNVGELAGFRYGQGTGGTYAGENGGFVDEEGYNFSMRDGFGRPNGALLRLYNNVFNLGNSDGHFVFFKSDSQGGGADGAAIHVDANNLTVFKTDNNHTVTGSILWDDGTVYTNSRITKSTSDSPPSPLADGDIFLVYENS